MMKYFLLLTLFISQNLYAQKDTITFFKKQIKISVFKAEHQFSAEVKDIIAEHTNLRDLRVTAKIEIDYSSMIRNYGLENLEQISKEKLLPGLDFDKGMVLNRLNQIKPTYDDIIKAMSILQLKISTYYALSDDAKKVIETSINNYVKQLEIPKIDIEFIKVNEMIKDGMLIKAEIIQSKDQENKSEMPKENLLLYLAILVVSGFIIVTLIVVYMLKRVASRLAMDLEKSMQKIEISTSSALPSPSNGNHNDKKSNVFEGVPSISISETYEQILNKLKEILDNDLVKFVARFLTEGEEVKLFAVLSNCIPSSEKEVLLADSGPYFQDLYDDFIRYEASSFVSNTDEMMLAAKNLYKLVWLAKENKEDFSYIMLDAKLRNLSFDKLNNLISKLEDDEFSFILTLLSPDKIALLVSNNSNLIDTFERIKNVEQVATDVIDRVNEKLYERVELEKEGSGGKLSDISKYLPYELENRFNKAVGIESSVFDRLNDASKTKIITILNSMDMDSLKALLPGLPTYLVEEFMSQLPELKANRLRFGDTAANENTLYLKNELIRNLYENN